MVLKIRELIRDVTDLNGVAFSNGREIVDHALRWQLSTGKIEGAFAFIGIYDKLREKGFSKKDSVDGALDGAEQVVRLEEAQRQVSRTQTPPTTQPVVATLVAEYVNEHNRGGITYDKINSNRITEETIRGIATDAARAALSAQPKQVSFEDSLSDHERKCAVCREEALKLWNAKKGAK